jgi:tetratricopeptide (TPR) repeat protein
VARTKPVSVHVTEETIPTYLPAAPDRHPMFLEKRVYQGSSGRVYPLPFTDRISETTVDRVWKAIWLENEYLRVMVLPEIGGRIHVAQDKTNGYDLIYRQPVIKPALVGLAGPWISGGIEFNWPQHHRPATFLRVDVHVEQHTDGSQTVWMSDHDPMGRMKGMHGVCLHPGEALIELKVRVYNRTALTQTFLWWANVATRVHEAYQSFFPPDVYYVADHARRSVSEYPLAQGFYYGVNYGERARTGIPAHDRPRQFVPPHARPAAALSDPRLPDYAPNDLSFYANIPTPCSYMCMGSERDFFGGYDYFAQAGIIHIANHHISPGKKQWTWGNHEFGYAWDRNLTEPDHQGQYGPYIEIMAGVYTDNQPDFSFLQPGETKTWSQYWYPIQQIGPAQHANLNAAVSWQIVPGNQNKVAPSTARLGISVVRCYAQATVRVTARGESLYSRTCDLAPGQPLVADVDLPSGVEVNGLRLEIVERSGAQIISYQPQARTQGRVPPPATEPPAPENIASTDELYITGLHLDQYRHATRCPTLYWREALRRDPFDARSNNALGVWHLKRGEFGAAERHFRRAIERLTRRNANPSDGEPFYHLGLCLRYQGRDDDAYAALYKATWNQAWAAAGYHALAEIDCTRHDWATGLEHLNRALRLNTDNLRARNLLAIVLRKLGHDTQATEVLDDTLALDPLDWWARNLRGDALECDLQVRLDVAHDYARAGLVTEAIELLQDVGAARMMRGDARDAGASDTSSALPDQSWGALPLVHYTLGWLEQQRSSAAAARQHFAHAAAVAPDYCFPARLEEIAILEAAMRADPTDARAPYYLGNLLYDRRRHEEAIRLWEVAAKLDPHFSIVWRNLGIGYFNIRRKPTRARTAYERAFQASPQDARLLYERDQLWKRLGQQPAKRLRALERHRALVQQRDDLSVELCALYNQTGAPGKTLALLTSRTFQPWEGGEGGPLGQWVRAHLTLGRQTLAAGDIVQATVHLSSALTAPENLGEARHLLANQSDVHYWLGCALTQGGNPESARQHFLAAATARGDFQEMSVRAWSEMTYCSALAWKKLGKAAKANKLLRELLAYAQRLQKTPATIDYFATSLPTLLLFEDDVQARQETQALFLQAQARLGLGDRKAAQRLLRRVLEQDPNHALAADLIGECSPS